MEKKPSVLDNFHPLVAAWFAESIGMPTDVQVLAWPQIASGEHVLISAPTGSGKTMAAFLSAIDALITGKWPRGRLNVLYVSPLKALNNDIRRNLLRPLSEIKAVFAKAGEPFPSIEVAVRSGDTSQSERRRMLREPPEILITTPESINLLLSSNGGRSILTNIRTVILDEIHAVADSKRGVHLITAVDRLVPLSGEFQRIALSATVRPLETVARFVGGYRLEGNRDNPEYRARSVRIVASAQKKDYELTVRFPEAAAGWNERDSFWQPFVDEIKGIVARNRSTLIFANSRRLCEKLTHLINENEAAPVAYAHHGSLSREIRTEVERKLKAGELRAIVATNSLEMGIDIGALDEVVLLQAPPSFSSAIQRIGRAGHRVGEASRGTLIPTDSTDVLHAAVLASGIAGRDIEALRPVSSPLDILAQIVVSMTGVETWDIDELYARLKTSYPYQSLSRRQFDLVIEMLAGRYEGSRLRELKPRIAVDKLENTVSARKGALQAVYFSGGTIPDRGYFHLRHNENGALIGELDEEFVWEAKIGQVFTLSTQNWKIERITHNDVFVTPTRPGAAAPPFWKAEENLRDSHFSERIADFLEAAEDLLEDPEVKEFLRGNPIIDEEAAGRLMDFPAAGSPDHPGNLLSALQGLDRSASARLITFLVMQKHATGRPLPHRHHLLVEHAGTGPGGYPGNQIVLHTVWGGRINRPFTMALEAAWEDRYGYRPETYPGNDCIMLQLPHEADGEEILSLVTGANFYGLIKRKLEGSGFFGAVFRECAGRALLLTRNRQNERMPLWLSRLRSQTLLDSVLQYEDFPILLEAWRTCLNDELDLEGLKNVLGELEAGVITWSEADTGQPSPMARSITWPQINQYMYMDDQPKSGKGSRLRSDLLHEVVSIPELRPAVSREAVERFELKRQRLSPGYSPESAGDLVEWVKERLLLPESEWEKLLDAVRRDHGIEADVAVETVSEKLARIHPPKAAQPLVVAIEDLPRIGRGLYGDIGSVVPSRLDTGEAFPASELQDVFSRLDHFEPNGDDPDELFSTILAEWLQFYGPRGMEFMQESLGLDADRTAAALEALVDTERLVSGRLIEGDRQDTICDSQNYESMLRIARAEAVPVFSALGIESLQLFLAEWQGLAGPEPEAGPDGLYRRIEQLAGCPASAELWESEIFPARLKPYDPSWLDSIIQQSDLRWIGMEGRRAAFSFEPDLDLVQEEDGGDKNHARDAARDDNSGDSPPMGEDSGGKRPFLRVIPGSAKAREEYERLFSLEKGMDKKPGEPADDTDISGLFPSTAARYDFSALANLYRGDPAELAAKIWKEVWRGRLTNDTFASLRHGIENGFKVMDPVAIMARRSRRRRGSGRTAFSMWKGSLPMVGNWMRLQWPEREDDLLARAERDKERVRMLLDRYGILFRELLQNEGPPFAWRNIFRALRLMELSGEVLTGYFFEGVPGPQFISHEAFRVLRRKLPEDSVYWICATDPASLCGMRIDALRGTLPRRIAGTHLVYRGRKLVMESRRAGKAIVFHVPADDPDIQSYLGVFQHLLTRRFQPMRRIVIESAAGIPIADLQRLLSERFDVVKDGEKLNVYVRYSSKQLPKYGRENE